MKQLNKLALALAATLVAGSVMAEGPQLYAVLGAGKAEFQDYCSGAQDCDDSDTSWKVAGGAQFNQYLAVEFQYQDFGDQDAGAIAAGGRGYDGDGKAFGIHVLPQLPITEELSAYFRLGFVRAGVSYDYKDGSGDGSFYDTTNEYGLGLQYNIDKHFAVRVEAETIHNVGDDEGFNSDDTVDIIGVSGVYKF
jgi:OOP family OmpA-OmpF porin